MSWSRRRLTHATGGVVVLALTLAACAGPPAAPTSDGPARVQATEQRVSGAPTASRRPTPGPTPAEVGAEAGFRAWLAASRKPDVGVACDRLSPELAARMVAEINATGPAHVEDCAQMIAATAALYRATGQSAAVDIDVQRETASDATLFVTYDSGDCGTVVMRRPATVWILTEQSQECAR